MLSVVDQEDMMGQFPWVLYVTLAEMFTRVIPSFLLVFLNTRMIKRFHEVIEKRGIMRAKNFMEGSSKLNFTITKDTIEAGVNNMPLFCQKFSYKKAFLKLI